MTNVRRTIRISTLLFAGACAISALAALTSTPTQASGIRFCCNTQQSNACVAQGGTPSCRTGVCQCLF